MRAQHLAQRGVQQVRGRVVRRDQVPPRCIHLRAPGTSWLSRNALDAVHRQLIFFERIQHANRLAALSERTYIAYLPAALGVEGRAVQHRVYLLFFVGLHDPVAQNLGVAAQQVIAHEQWLGIGAHLHPVAGRHFAGLLRPRLLLGHLRLEARYVHG